MLLKLCRNSIRLKKYGKLHRTLFKHGIRIELYIGDGIEMYYPYVYKPVLTLQLFDNENLVILDEHEPKLKDESQIIKKIRRIAKSLNYKVVQINELPHGIGYVRLDPGESLLAHRKNGNWSELLHFRLFCNSNKMTTVITPKAIAIAEIVELL